MKTLCAPGKARAPDGMRLVAVGDIHGRLDLLDALLDRIVESRAAFGVGGRDRLIFLGDYIDRGPDAAGVLTRLADLSMGPQETVFLMGNHEDMMLRVHRQADVQAAMAWMVNGGGETLRSYGVAPPLDIYDPAELERCRQALQDALPDAHRRFLDGLAPYHRTGGFIFVHAGLRPDVPLAEQRTRDLLWIRDPFLRSTADFGGVVVHGHTPVPAPEIRPNRICIDTGAGKGGDLTAALIWGSECAFLHATAA